MVSGELALSLQCIYREPTFDPRSLVPALPWARGTIPQTVLSEVWALAPQVASPLLRGGGPLCLSSIATWETWQVDSLGRRLPLPQAEVPAAFSILWDTGLMYLNPPLSLAHIASIRWVGRPPRRLVPGEPGSACGLPWATPTLPHPAAVLQGVVAPGPRVPPFK